MGSLAACLKTGDCIMLLIGMLSIKMSSEPDVKTRCGGVAVVQG